MDAQRGQQKINHKNFLQHYLHNRMAASSTVILAGLLCAADVVAESRTWVGGSAYVPKAAITLPVPFNGTGGIESFIKAGELSDSAGNKITSLEQFNLLRDDKSQVMRIDQKSGRVILNWESFDIPAGQEVKFVQPSTTSLALNKINNSTSPSEILGKLTANGGVYLINHNGIIFGNGSQVNVGSLVASSLDVDDDLFSYKSLSKAMMDDDKAAFSLNDNKDATGTVLQAQAKYDENNKSWVIEYRDAGQDPANKNAPALRGDIAIADGAKINTTTLNGAVLVAPNVVNEGDIKTPDGQTILAAAKDEAFVLFSSDPALRGLLIEVNAGGDVTNLGNIIAERGNVTLAGLAVNVGNDATIRATTSVDFNGTIRLLARDTLAANPAITAIDQVSALLTNYTVRPNEIAAKEGENKYRIASHGGNVIIGKNAIIEVTPELDSKKTAVTAQTQGMSGVEISGNTILLKEGANITAKGGNIFLEATNNISLTIDQSGYLYTLSDKSRITLEKNSSIDVSGVQVDLPMSRNVVEVELRGTELADSPLQRSGFLYGKKVLVDIRKGTPLGDISGALAAIPKTVGERLTEGGSIQLRSAGDVVVQKDAKLNVSGGGIHYAAGYVETTNLLSEGKIVNIADADPARTYTGILGKETATNKRFNITQTFNNFFISSDRGEFVNAFDQGSSAGAFTLKTQAASFNGSVLAGTLSGVDQRDPTKTNHPDGGTFNLEVNLQNIGIADIGTVNCNDTAPCVLLKTTTLNGGIKVNFATDTLTLAQDIFNTSGFEHYNITARNGGVVLSDKANLQLADGASLKVTATDSIDINGTIKSTGGKVSFTTEKNKDIGSTAVGGNYDVNNLNRPITLSNSAVIDTSGSCRCSNA
jgi:filamentous hemagglutinin